MEDVEVPHVSHSTVVSTSDDPNEARLEAREFHKYLLAKSYFDCREFERCAAVFLPYSLSKEPRSPSSPQVKLRNPQKAAKGKSKELDPGNSSQFLGPIPPCNTLPQLSQKSLFLALYAKYMSGEKRKEEESEMILGPADKGSAINRELVGISGLLEGWFAARRGNQKSDGWMEYLYGIVLAKGKSDEEAMKWLIKSVHLFPFNWGAWLELNGLVGSVEEVSHKLQTLLGPRLSLSSLIVFQWNCPRISLRLYSIYMLARSSSSIRNMYMIDLINSKKSFLKACS